MVNPPFIPRRIELLRPNIERIAHELIDRFEHQQQADLLDVFARHVPVLVIAGFLGVPEHMAPQLLEWSHDMVAIYQVRRDHAIEQRAVAATEAFSAYMRTLLEERRRTLGDDVLSSLLQARDGNGAPMSTEELVTTAILLLNAGHEATVHGIGNGVAALLAHADDPARSFLADPVGVVEEMLRYDPPLHLFTRYALDDLEYQGLPFRRGDKVGLLLGAANRDPRRFPDAERFDVTRRRDPHVAFGAGLHACVGAPLARLEMQAALGVLFTRLPGLRAAGPAPVADTWHFRSRVSLPVAW
jgi:cytochrome P450